MLDTGFYTQLVKWNMVQWKLRVHRISRDQLVAADWLSGDSVDGFSLGRISYCIIQRCQIYRLESVVCKTRHYRS